MERHEDIQESKSLKIQRDPIVLERSNPIERFTKDHNTKYIIIIMYSKIPSRFILFHQIRDVIQFQIMT